MKIVLMLMILISMGHARDIDFDKSHVRWVGSKKIGAKHNGQFKIMGSGLKLSKDQSKIEMLYFTVKIESLEVLDLEGKSKKSLEDHLLGADFFESKKFPMAYFKSKKITAKEVTGDLTIKGIKKEITFGYKRDKKVLSAKFKINRSNFGMIYGQSNKLIKLIANKVINDEVDMDIRIELK